MRIRLLKRSTIEASPAGRLAGVRSPWMAGWAAALVLATGCSLPIHETPMGRRISAPPPASPPPASPPSGQPDANVSAAAAATPAAAASPTAATAHVSDLPPAATAAPRPAIAQVGHAVPATFATHRSACGCNACGSGGGAPQGCQTCPPHGYVMPTPQGWNAYGIDPQEFLCDGGDRHPEAIVTRDDRLAGLGLEDTVVHYTTEAGDIHVQPSNRACLYAPRFIAVRKLTGAVAGERAIGPGGFDRPIGPVRVDQDLPGLAMTESTRLGHADVNRRIDSMKDRNRGVPVEGILQPKQAADVKAALAALKLYDLGQLRDNELAVIEKLALAAVPWTVDESLDVVVEDLAAPTLTRDQRVEGLTIYEFPDAGRLRVVKMADRADALPGETVSFVIRIDNAGDSPVNTVVLTDNLTTRLEYVPDSQTVEGAEANFTTDINEGQSLKLKWQLAGPLKVGQSVTIRFQCKVR